MRDRALQLGLVTLGVVVVSTEVLSGLEWVTFWTVLVVWIGLAAGWWIGLRDVRPRIRWDWASGLMVGCCAVVWLVEGVAALVSPPNSSDAMAYHMPRVVYWVQQKSVAFFATPYLNQIMLQPLQEYVTLHGYLLAGGDRLANAVAWISTGGYVMAASLMARSLGADGRGQALAALFAATLPNGILQATGAKNDALLSLLLVALVYFALEGKRWWVGLAFGLACFTKGTAYLFCGPLLLLLLPRAVPQALVGLLLINGVLFVRNVDLSGSPLGFDSAQGDGVYRWRNERFGWEALSSNLLRHATEQLGERSEDWNQRVYGWSLAAHGWLGIDANDKATTWAGEVYRAPRSANHETDTNNRWHLLVIVLAAGMRRSRRDWLVLGGLVLGVAAFCGYLRWQPFMLRMWLPLFVCGVAWAAVGWGRVHLAVRIAVCVFLLSGCRLPLLKGWIRPLVGPESVFAQSRQDLYFADMKTWKVQGKYLETLEELKRLGCRNVGMDIERFQLEYPLQALLIREMPGVRFEHVGTKNASKKYEKREWEPCVVVCLACDRWVMINERQ